VRLYSGAMPAPSHTIDLGLGVYLDYSFVGRTELDYDVRWESTEVVQGSISLGQPSGPVSVASDLVRGQLQFTLDGLTGVLGLVATLEVREPGVQPPVWKTVVNRTDPDLASIDPTNGEVAGSQAWHPPVMPAGFGPSGPSGDGVTRFHISDEVRLLADVGRIVKQRMFPDTPPLTLNIVACCGAPTGAPTGPGVYADPESVWFNVFFGAYQMDCSKADGWTRPFGYESAAGAASVVRGEDLARVGKSDWNWFSNYLYGVPEEVCVRYSNVDMSAITFTPTATVQYGSSRWHLLTMSGVEVASAYQSDAAGAERLVENSLLTPTWQSSFGLPCPRPNFATSFIPTVLRSTLLMSYSEDAEGYHTLMFGGTSSVDAPSAFLQAQVQAAVQAIEVYYPSAGFSLAASWRP